MQRLPAILPALLLVGALVSSCGEGEEGPAPTTSSIKTLTGDGAWSWFADPRAVYFKGEHERAYVGWVSRDGDVRVASYDHASKQVSTATLNEGLQRDDHAAPALLFLADGRLATFYSRHNGDRMFYRIAKAPEDISSWGEEREIRVRTKGKSGYTFPNAIRLGGEDDKIYLFWRGGHWDPTFSTSRDGIEWSPARTLIRKKRGSPYIKVASHGVDRIHLAFTDGHPRTEERNSIYYACYRDGALYRADGSKIRDMASLPIGPADGDRVYGGGTSGARAWIWDVAAGRSERPVIVYAVFPEKTDHRYRYARWNGRAWEDHEITAAGGWFQETPEGEEEKNPYYSGGIALDHGDPSVVYLSRPVQGIFEIERWKTRDGGKTWASESITSGSRMNNVRPVVPRGHEGRGAEVIWMNGGYVHYKKYRTGVMGRAHEG